MTVASREALRRFHFHKCVISRNVPLLRKFPQKREKRKKEARLLILPFFFYFCVYTFTPSFLLSVGATPTPPPPAGRATRPLHLISVKHCRARERQRGGRRRSSRWRFEVQKEWRMVARFNLAVRRERVSTLPRVAMVCFSEVR